MAAPKPVRRLGRERRCGGNSQTLSRQHLRNRGFGTVKLLELIDFRPLFQIRMTLFKEVRYQLLISNDESV